MKPKKEIRTWTPVRYGTARSASGRFTIAIRYSAVATRQNVLEQVGRPSNPLYTFRTTAAPTHAAYAIHDAAQAVTFEFDTVEDCVLWAYTQPQASDDWRPLFIR